MNRSTWPWCGGLIVGSLAILLACTGAEKGATPPEERVGMRLHVQTTCFPVDWLVARIGGERIDRVNALPPGEDPPHWQPSGETIAELSRADLIVVNGAGFEKWMLTATLPLTRVVDTSKGLDLIETESSTHSHGVKGKHSHSGTDPHTWSDPLTYVAQARTVYEALVAADPANATHYEANLQALVQDLEALDADYRLALASGKGVRMASNHPAYAYLARRYGLEIHPFGLDPEQAPEQEEVDEILALTQAPNPAVLLWEATPLPDVKAAFPERVLHIVIDPLEQPPDGGVYDYLAQARTNIATFEKLFAEVSGGGTD
jgi:zinc transport system substrate-binding protein